MTIDDMPTNGNIRDFAFFDTRHKIAERHRVGGGRVAVLKGAEQHREQRADDDNKKDVFADSVIHRYTLGRAADGTTRNGEMRLWRI